MSPLLQRAIAASALFGLLALASFLTAQQPATKAPPFGVQDPFDPANELKKLELDRVFAPQAKGSSRDQLKPTPIDDRIDFAISISPELVRRGQTARLTIKATPRPGFHTFPITKKSADKEQDVGQLTKLTIDPQPGLQVLWPIEETEPELEIIKNVGAFLEHKKEVTWSQDILVLADATPGEKKLRISLRVQVCDETCIQGYPVFEKAFRVTEEPAIPLTQALEQRRKVEQPAVQLVPVPGTDVIAVAVNKEKEGGLVGLMLVSMVAALLMLCTPCVFPMIPITVTFFLKQSEKEHHNALLTAAVYSLTIIIILAAAVLLLGDVIVRLANNTWLNLAFGALLVFFALSLFGMYEIELPSGLARFTSAHEGKGGYIGALFMALTFTITSFTCTGPFLGPLLVATKEYQLNLGERALGALVYSATFAAPFFVLALFPSLLKKLPKSGGWLNAVKVVMGFIEMALALKFLANTDIALNPGRPMLFNYETVLCAWIALSLACGLYLFGVFRLPHDSPVESLSVMRMLLGGVFLGLAIYMVPAMWRVSPQGLIGQFIVATLPLDTKAREGELKWSYDYEEAWKQALDENKLIFVDFTGVNCTNCRSNEKNVFALPEVQQALKGYVRVQLYTDSVPDPRLSPAEATRQAERNSGWMEGTFGDISLPLYAIFRPTKGALPFEDNPGGKQKLRGFIPGLTRKGFIRETEIPDFERFLLRGQMGQCAIPVIPTRDQIAGNWRVGPR